MFQLHQPFISVHGLQCPMVRLFNRQSHLRCLNNIRIGGETDCFLEVIVNPPYELFASNMDDSTTFCLVLLQTRGNVKLQLRIS
jgi:hypothetical protein